MAVNKPSGLLVHRSWLDKAETRFAMQMTRDLIGGRHVYPVHRLDRPTSGVLLFCSRSCRGPYPDRGLCCPSGPQGVPWHWCGDGPPKRGLIDHPLKEQLDKIADAFSDPDRPPRKR